MFATAEHKVAVDFVRHHKHTVFTGQASYLGQSLAAPLNPGGIVGVAENHHLRMLVGKNPLKLREIHLITHILGQHQRVRNHYAAIALDDDFERVINRWLDNHFVTLAGEKVDGKSNPFHNTRHIGQFLAPYFEIMALAQPAGNRTPVGITGTRIPVNRMRYAVMQGFGNLRANPEIHVGNPQRRKVILSEQRTQIVDFRTTATMAVNHFVKIILFHRPDKILG